MLKKIDGLRLLVFISLTGTINIYCSTTFLANFENGYDAIFAKGSPKAIFGIKIPEGSVKITEGKFGKGLFLDKNVGSFQFGYETRDNFKHEEGTVEFWFKPEWDSDYKDPEGPSWWQGGSLYTIFSTLEPPTGFRLQKNHYNYLSYHYVYNYKQYASVGLSGKFWNKGDWVHLAASWDQNEGRLFINGKLVAVSDQWQVSTPYEYRMYLSGWGTFDDFRVSDKKIYVSSFPVPDKPLQVEKQQDVSRDIQITGDEKELLKKENVLFYVDFGEGLTPKFTNGSGQPFTNKTLEIEGKDEMKSLRLKRTGITPENTLCYLSAGNINQFLGTVEIAFRLSEHTVLPAILFDVSEIEQQTASQSHRRTGMRLLLNKDMSIEWQNLLDGRVISSVISKPIELKRDEWNRVGFSWKPASVCLFNDKTLLIESKGIPLPVKLANYIFIGSDSFGEEVLDGWIKEVKIIFKYWGE